MGIFAQAKDKKIRASVPRGVWKRALLAVRRTIAAGLQMVGKRAPPLRASVPRGVWKRALLAVHRTVAAGLHFACLALGGVLGSSSAG